jgi:hypothetical protein
MLPSVIGLICGSDRLALLADLTRPSLGFVPLDDCPKNSHFSDSCQEAAVAIKRMVKKRALRKTRRGSQKRGERRGRGVLAERANRHAADVASTVKTLQAAGVTSLAAKRPQALQRRSTSAAPTASGQGTWQAVQVSRVLARLG